MIIDLILVGIIAICAFVGYKRGLVKSAIKILSFFIAIVVALTFYKPISNLIINKTTIDESIQNTIIEKINLNQDNNEEGTINIQNMLKKTANNTINDMAKTLSIKIIEIGTVILLYIISRIILRFISALGDLIAKLPLLKQFNEIGGLAYGLIKGILIIHILLTIVYLVSPLISKETINSIDKTILTKFLYNNNVITNVIL